MHIHYQPIWMGLGYFAAQSCNHVAGILQADSATSTVIQLPGTTPAQQTAREQEPNQCPG
jgi:hypothetical protein